VCTWLHLYIGHPSVLPAVRWPAGTARASHTSLWTRSATGAPPSCSWPACRTPR
jgi:hypothetical protein